MEKLPIYYAKINEETTGLEYKEQGVQNIALVDSPAMLTEWLMFNSHKKMEFAISEEKRIITAPVIIADLPIYRMMDGKEFYVVYDKATIMQIAQKYSSENRNKLIKVTHDTNQIAKDVFVFETFISDESRGISAPKGFESLPDGTWYVSMKVNNDEVWNQAKKGILNGISLEGYFDLEQAATLTDSEVKAIIESVVL